jgi:peptidoglycan hydrolase-like protein with peptidoglycan-binding domain
MCAADTRGVRRRAARLALSALAVVTAGCAVSPRDHAPFFQALPVENRPVTAPVRSISSFSDSLACMDKMLGDYGKGTTLITSKIIPDASGKISVATKDMAITALSQMSRTSNAFRYVDYEVEALKQDTVQNLTTLLLNAGQMHLVKPALYISGAISYLDQNVMINRLGLGIAAERWEAGYNRDLQGSAFGLELHLGDFNSRTLLSGIDSANEIVVANTARALDAGGRIRKTGVQFNLAQEVSQGTGPAVRTLVELGLIELVGKWARVPYWQCLAIDQAHPEYQRQLQTWWLAMSGDERLRLFQTALRSSGYFAGATDGKPSPALREAIVRAQADRGVTPSGSLDFETYEKLVRDYVKYDGAGTFVRVGWSRERRSTDFSDPDKGYARGGAAKVENNPAYTPQAAAARLPVAPIDAATARPVGLRVSVGEPNREFAVGESLVTTVSVDRQAYVYCYYRDGRRRVTQIFPNPTQNRLPLQGGRFVQIPDTTGATGFAIALERAGEEAVMCFAPEKEVSAKLPPELRVPALTPIAAGNDFDAIRQAFERAAGTPVEQRLIQYRVRKPT